jgi:hypothetical protein
MSSLMLSLVVSDIIGDISCLLDLHTLSGIHDHVPTVVATDGCY